MKGGNPTAVLRKKPLAGKTVLITRAAAQAPEFAKIIEELGGITVVFPTVKISPPVSWAECDTVLRRIHEYDGFIFTSVNAVDFFFRRALELQVPDMDLRSKPAYAVGQKTKSALQGEKISVVAIPDHSTAENLASIVSEDAVRGKKFIFPRGSLSRDVIIEQLRALGATVDSVVVYQTTKAGSGDIDGLKGMIREGKIDVVTFASPSAAEGFVEMFSSDERREIRRLCKIAVIGPTTKQALEARNIASDIVAAQSTVRGLAESIAKFFRSQAS